MLALFLTLAAAALSPCDEDCPTELVLAAADAADNGVCPRGDGEEACICAALRLGRLSIAKESLRSRLLRREQAPNVRRFAQRRKEAAHVTLARVHPRYPRHLKFIPAVVWAQSDEVVHVRVRHSRYTSGDVVIRGVERGTSRVELSDQALYYSAEGDDVAAFVETTLRFHSRLARVDGCADQEARCVALAMDAGCEARAGDESSDVRSRCAQSCGGCTPLVANGTRVHAAWAALKGELVLEARKSSAEPWPRLFIEKNDKVPNRVHHIRPGEQMDGQEQPVVLPGEPQLGIGALLGCVDACFTQRCASGWGGDVDGEGIEYARESECHRGCRSECASTSVGRTA